MTEVNELRDAMVKTILAQHHGEPVAAEHLAQYFPPDFDLGDDDLQPYQQPAEVLPAKVNGHAAEGSTAPVIDPAAIEAATQRRIAADQSLANRRVELLAAQDAERVARDKLATAVTTFQRGFAPVTPEQLRRSHVAEQAEIRAAIKDGRLNPRKNPGIGKSVIDRQAFYSRGGNPARGDFRRGAFPSQAYGMPNRDPARGPVAVPPAQIVVK